VFPPDRKFRRRYDWSAVQAFSDAGHSITDCQERFGFACKTWHDARACGDVVSRRHGLPPEDYFVAGRPATASSLRSCSLRKSLRSA
jgi:hypothetical protein